LNDEHNEPLKILGTIQDVTDQKKYERELTKSKRTGRTISAVKEQFQQ
jgi:hypothetical protein